MLYACMMIINIPLYPKLFLEIIELLVMYPLKSSFKSFFWLFDFDLKVHFYRVRKEIYILEENKLFFNFFLITLSYIIESLQINQLLYTINSHIIVSISL